MIDVTIIPKTLSDGKTVEYDVFIDTGADYEPTINLRYKSETEAQELKKLLDNTEWIELAAK